ncbi:MAG: hypothetical protein P0Y53_20550 [Candidatus Pseudobacter hemicellulosilyticus]|uniref:Tetratricopeptide repeat protein n=1 Tax=Candidatus Pseudobacter hemicellulosilyticus TaxID=3121375 RepID=A0AAJ5WQG1_9BACT|nr:MAG: hypothetical protein P0Y53_20550 [Pseudobacter sp.]
MQHHIQTIVQHLFRKNSLRDVAEKDIEQFAANYPYATIGQFLLAEKWRQTQSDKFQEQAFRASLYFNNPTWLSWQLRENQEVRETVAALPADLRLALAAGHKPGQALAENATETASGTEVPEQTPAIENATGTPGPAVLTPDALVSSPAAETAGNHVAVQPEPPAPSIPGIPTVAADATEASFEPYHTIDYFASQGIKLRLEELTRDKLGQQLKSFTDWLRSMKKVTPTNAIAIDDSTQQSIQLIAEHSVEGKEIVTEAMAEVWLKQGNRARAVAIYEKLSLLNPPKSTFFADRIKQIKAL